MLETIEVKEESEDEREKDEGDRRGWGLGGHPDQM
jgi:hypothetical protein